jgi:hypothetical protein
MVWQTASEPYRSTRAGHSIPGAVRISIHVASHNPIRTGVPRTRELRFGIPRDVALKAGFIPGAKVGIEYDLDERLMRLSVRSGPGAVAWQIRPTCTRDQAWEKTGCSVVLRVNMGAFRPDVAALLEKLFGSIPQHRVAQPVELGVILKMVE